jgi:hypothetical protein
MPIVAGVGFYTPREISTMSEEQVFHALTEQAEADPIGAFGEVGSIPCIEFAAGARTKLHLSGACVKAGAMSASRCVLGRRYDRPIPAA